MTIHVLDVVDARLTCNALRCLECGRIIQSTHRHDYRTCGCPNGAMVDGGLAYLRWGAVDPSRIEGLSEQGPPSEWNGNPLTCQRCDEGCDMYGDHGPLRCEHSGCCPECVDGHPIIEHQVPWPVCDDDCPCIHPGRTVRVSIQAVPIMDGDLIGVARPVVHVRPSSARTVYPTEYGRLSAYLYSDSGGDRHLDLADTARPGQYAIIGTEMT